MKGEKKKTSTILREFRVSSSTHLCETFGSVGTRRPGFLQQTAVAIPTIGPSGLSKTTANHHHHHHHHTSGEFNQGRLRVAGTKRRSFTWQMQRMDAD